MGIPKFARFIAERYPCILEAVKQNEVPEFDNMYLDMNGIVHCCSHPDDHNPHFRITEEQIFKDIFHYLDVLFRLIKPKKTFFMSVDGVAPRAKMNQQRGRRFRTAKEIKKQEKEVLEKGESLPTEARFDPNCITPGTEFMARLQEQFKYFCVNKISTDPLWKDVKVILSGQETPGEGEHKIMDYIRYIRSQPDYDPNTRHCLYGLDADLIILGLCTHELHFCLLREEVKFGRKNTKTKSVPEEIQFYLLHISLMREYLELEFSPVKDKLIDFKFDIEKIVDDWILLGFLVGNDFIPHLPHLHIFKGALPYLYKTYMTVLPTLGGYINESGNLNLSRFEQFLQVLSNFDLENFSEIRDDLFYMEAKTGRKMHAHSKVSTNPDADEDIIEDIQESPNQSKSIDPALAALIQETDELDTESSEDDTDDPDDKAFRDFKNEYYMHKLEYSKVTPEILRDQAVGYIRAIQWNLNYYYKGCCSWSWFYPHHYAPYMSDIKGFVDEKIEFDLGSPLSPFEQLLAILPEKSKHLLPTAYHNLMTSDESIIKKYYPEDFELDMNEKRQDWEALVLIPFIDEKLLLKAMEECNENLTEDEKKRNTHGPMQVYSYSGKDEGKYYAPDYFPPVPNNYCKVEQLPVEALLVPKQKLRVGLLPDGNTDMYYPGFPTLRYIKHTSQLKHIRVKVFEQPSREESIVLSIINDTNQNEPSKIPLNLLGKQVYINWPHLVEGRVVEISNSQEKYVHIGEKEYNMETVTDPNKIKFESTNIIERYATRWGVEVGDVHVLCHIQVATGKKYVFAPNGDVRLETQYSKFTMNYPLQTIVTDINVPQSKEVVFQNVREVFLEGEECFTLSQPYYGAQGKIVDTKDTTKTGRIKICVKVAEEPVFTNLVQKMVEITEKYRNGYQAASQISMSQFLFSRVTGSLWVERPDGQGGFKSTNIGLNLKFTKKNEEIPGYTKRDGNTWLYSDKCAELVLEYSEKYPEVFSYFSQNESFENAKVEAVFPGDDWDVKLNEVRTWLKQIPTANLERKPCGSDALQPEIIQELESYIDNYTKSETKKITMSTKPSFLYKPELHSATLPPDPTVLVRLFDRVVCSRKNSTVPFGLKGTVTSIPSAIEDDCYDVVFDRPFEGGLSLNCSAGRGYKLNLTSFINISHGKRVREKRIDNTLPLSFYPQKTWQRGQPVPKLFDSPDSDKQPLKKRLPSQPPLYPTGNGPFGQKQRQWYPAGDVPTDSLGAFALFRKLAPAGTEEPTVKNRNQLSPKQIHSGKANRKEKRSEQPPNSNIENMSLTKPKSKCQDGDVRKQHDQSPKKTQKQPQNCFMPEFKYVENTNHNDSNSIQDSNNVVKQDLLAGPGQEAVDFFKSFVKGLKITGSKPEPPTSNLTFDMIAKHVGDTPASTRLLTYYQSNGLGLPRYEYYRDRGAHIARITLSRGETITSDLANNQQAATESVASKALAVMMKKASPMPPPPKTWIPSNVATEHPHPAKAVNKERVETAPIIKHAFVPTQVIKRQGSRSITQVAPVPVVKESDDKKATQKKEQLRSQTQPEVANPGGEQKPLKSIPRKRASRIAANFKTTE